MNTFTQALAPLSPPPARLPSPQAPTVRRPLVLLVDDVPANLHVLALALRDEYRIKTATDGAGALAIAGREDRPDVILCDVMMPGMSGHEVLRHLRAEPATCDIPVIFITADTTEGNELIGLELGAVDFLTKPVNVPVVRARVRNLMAQRELQRCLQLNELKLRAMLDSSMQFIGLLDTRGCVLHVNRQVLELLGQPLEEVVGVPFWETGLWSAFPRQCEDVHMAVLSCAKGHATRFETLHYHRDGSGLVFDFSLRPVLGSQGEVAFLLPEATDITRQKASEENIRHLANNDPLTGLPNRTLLTDRVNQAIRTAERSKEPFSLLFLDLDRFKHINDTLGHACGDKLLKEISERLTRSVRLQDTVARMGGDEFVLLLPETPAAGAAVVAEKLLACIVEPCVVEMHELSVTPSIGISVYPHDGRDYVSLSKCADIAMYRAKREGRNTFRFFTEEMQERSSRTLRMESLLRQAVERQELVLHYQPQIDLASERCIGVEALLRWNSAELGLVSPAEFIPLAEETGMILPIGEWVLRSAVQQARNWLDAGRPMQVAVNVSTVQLRQREFPQMVARCLEQIGLPPHLLELELTESATFSNPESAFGMLAQLHICGVRLSIDDFGTGYSSLSYLKRIHTDKLKIDQSFVRDLEKVGEDATLVEAMINMARSLRVTTVAEGVETAGQLALLRRCGCDEVQGFLFSRPLPVAEFEAWLLAHEETLALRKGSRVEATTLAANPPRL